MSREQITAMLDGLDGVTNGPWIAPPSPSSMAGWPIVASTGRLIADVNYVQRTQIDPFVEGDKAFNYESKRNAAHIARCDPDTIRALCELALRGLELDALMATRTPVAAAIKMLTDADELRAENERLQAALQDIAKQKIHKEITDCDPDEIDWLCGYEGCVNRARRALERKPE